MASAATVAALARTLGAHVVETAVSWVLLGADEAWKIKKPLRLPFLDYASLESRRRACEAELALSRRFAPGLYLGVVPIGGTPQAPVLAGGGPVLDWAVRMRRFAADAAFDARLEAGLLGESEVDALAAWLAAVQSSAPRAGPGSRFGAPALRRAATLAALDGARPWMDAEAHAVLLARLSAQADALAPWWRARLDAGAVREGHGDLHLGNLLWLGGAVQAFDAIEFDPALRWIDVADEAAFPVMDLAARGRADLALRLLNAWLDASGGHAALPGLRHALAYRALVRTLAEGGAGRLAEARRYAAAALAWSAAPAPAWLAVTHGLPGSGKSTAALSLALAGGAVRLRSDVERKRLHGLAALADSRAAGLDLYGAQDTRRTYERLFSLAREALAAGWPVVLDAAFLRRGERDGARAVAAEAGVPFSIVECSAPHDVLRARLRARRGDASEADEGVLARLQAAREPLEDDERATAVAWPACRAAAPSRARKPCPCGATDP